MSSHVVNDWVITKVSFTRTWRGDLANQRKEPVSSVSSATVTPLSEDSAPVTPLSEDSAPVTPLSGVPAPNTAPVPNPVCRKTFFEQLQNEMAAATSYAGVHRIVVRTAEAVKNFSVAAQPDLYVTAVPQGSTDAVKNFPVAAQLDLCVTAIPQGSAEAVKNFPVAAQPDWYVTAIPQGSTDAVSLPLKPDDAPPHHFPVWVLGDGNCLPRTLSILAFGHPENFVEMRMRIIAELTINIAHYVSPSYLAHGSSTSGAKLL